MKEKSFKELFLGIFTSPHEHIWRPATLGGKPARVCDCGNYDLLTEGEFYSQFNRMPFNQGSYHQPKD